MRNVRFLLIFLSLCVLLLAACAHPREDMVRPQTAASVPATTADRLAVEQAVFAATDDDVAEKAAQLMLEQLAFDSGYALATWARGDAAGQALLHKEGEAWTVVAHGHGWMGVRGLTREGVPDEVARRLMDQIDPNWTSYETF